MKGSWDGESPLQLLNGNEIGLITEYRVFILSGMSGNLRADLEWNIIDWGSCHWKNFPCFNVIYSYSWFFPLNCVHSYVNVGKITTKLIGRSKSLKQTFVESWIILRCWYLKSFFRLQWNLCFILSFYSPTNFATLLIRLWKSLFFLFLTNFARNWM